jgi:hypothetical protein
VVEIPEPAEYVAEVTFKSLDDTGVILKIAEIEQAARKLGLDVIKLERCFSI